MKTIILVFGILLLSVALVSADGEHQSEIEEGKKLVDSGVNCDTLTNEQLETIGEYYMEQMHPGEQHEAMNSMMTQMMGEEGEEQMHVNMARIRYCTGNYTGYGGMMGSGGMMGMMPMMMSMMGGNMGYGMMGNNPFEYGYGYWSFWNIIWSLFWIGLIVLVIWLIYKFIIKREGLHETPIVILKKRYAKGEINKRQFEGMKKEIGK